MPDDAAHIINGLFANETNFFESGSASEEASFVLVAVLLVVMNL